MLTFDKLEFVVGLPIVLEGLTDNTDATKVSYIDGDLIALNPDKSFALNLPELAVGSYSITLKLYDDTDTAVEEQVAVVKVIEAPTEEPEAPASEPSEPTAPTSTPSGAPMANSPEAQALIDNSTTIQTFIPKYEPMTETNTDSVDIYPGSKIGFGPLSKSPNAATKADEFKIMSDEALAANPSAGFTGGRGTGNPDNFGKFPYRALMTDVRGEFFPKAGDFNANSPTQYPLGRTADILENTTYPTGFTQKDSEGRSTGTTRGGVNASPIQTSGFTF